MLPTYFLLPWWCTAVPFCWWRHDICTFDKDAEGGVLHAGQAHQKFIVRGKCNQVSIFIWNGIITVVIIVVFLGSKIETIESKRPSINTWNILCRTGLSCFVYVVHLLMAMLTFVKHVKSAVFQVGKDLCGLLAEVLKAGWDVLVHRKPPDLLDHLVLAQQVGLHCHRHSAPGCAQKLD